MANSRARRPRHRPRAVARPFDVLLACMQAGASASWLAFYLDGDGGVGDLIISCGFACAALCFAVLARLGPSTPDGPAAKDRAVAAGQPTTRETTRV